MIDTRARGQELQEQILAAARKGQQRVTSTVKNVTATAQMIRPQLPSMPTMNVIKLPKAEEFAQLRDKQLSQLRERAPGLIAKLPRSEQLAAITEKQLSQLREKAPGLIARLPNAEYFKAGANEVAGQVRTVQRQVTEAQRQVVDQVRVCAYPPAHPQGACWC